MSTLILFNKPFGVLSQFSGTENEKTLKDYINIPNVYPAGRLDKDSEGLLLLTDDGQLQHKISHPKNKLAKTYWVQVEGTPTETMLQELREGKAKTKVPYLPCKVKAISEPSLWPRVPPIRERQSVPTAWLQVVIKEGKNRQVRKMTAAIGLPTLRLVRVQIGQWQLGNLKPGEYSVLNV